MKKTIVISLGGSLIIPDKINYKFLQDFKKTLRKNYKTHKFVIVCGGGVIARKYISLLRKANKSQRELSLAGIRATKENARFMMQFFGKEANDILPNSMVKVKSNLLKNNVVFCGALHYRINSTTDETAARLAHYLKTDFINMTNVHGLYNKNPNKPEAKFIPEISWNDFEKIALKIKFHAGQHFILDQNSARLIKKHKTNTHILGSITALNNLLKRKKFIGTTISN